MTNETRSVPDGLAQQPRHLSGLDGLRGIAALLVVVHHASFASKRMYTGHFARQFTQLDVGVTIFFLLSGFLLFRPFLERSLFDREPAPLGGYALRRLVRIFPAYWLALVVISGVGALTDGRVLGWSGGLAPVHWTPYVLLMQVYRSLDEARRALNQSWTLAVELSFYVFLPVWSAVLARLVRRRDLAGRIRVHLWSLAALGAVGVAFRGLCTWGHVQTMREVGEYWLPANFDLFAIGMALAVVSVDPQFAGRAARALRRIAAFGVWCWVAAAVVFWTGANALGAGITNRPEGWAGIYKQEYHALVALLLVLPVALGAHAPATRRVTALLERRTLVYLGTISYGIYLWHQAWIVQAVEWSRRRVFEAPMPLLLSFGLGASVATAAISWHLVERPLVRWAARQTRGTQ